MTKNFKIYQVNKSAENARYILFSPLEFVLDNNLGLSLDKYNMVYESSIEVLEEESNITTLDNIFTEFNFTRPNDFKGHSLSLSDIVELDGKYYYCDSYGWEEVELEK